MRYAFDSLAGLCVFMVLIEDKCDSQDSDRNDQKFKLVVNVHLVPRIKTGAAVRFALTTFAASLLFATG